MAVELTAVLARHPGTVTELLERLAGEPIDADVLWRGPGPTGDDSGLGLGRHEETMRRTVLLTGRVTGRRFVYADSTIASGRLPLSVRRQLETGSEPIGRILSDHHLDIWREPLPAPPADHDHTTGFHPQIATLLASSPLARRYRLIIGTTPAMIVTEWFLAPASEALASHPPS